MLKIVNFGCFDYFFSLFCSKLIKSVAIDAKHRFASMFKGVKSHNLNLQLYEKSTVCEVNPSTVVCRYDTGQDLEDDGPSGFHDVDPSQIFQMFFGGGGGGGPFSKI